MPKASKPFGRGVELEPNAVYHVEGRGDYYTDASGQIRHAELSSAVERRNVFGMRNAMNPDLRDPLANATYTVDGDFHYTTDEWGRTKRLEIDSLENVSEYMTYRSNKLQAGIGKLGGSGYQGGHLGGSRFGGGPEEINVWPMRERINANHPNSFYRLEDYFAKNVGSVEKIVIDVKYNTTPDVAPGGSLSDLGPSNAGTPNPDRTPEEYIVQWKENDTAMPPKTFVN